MKFLGKQLFAKSGEDVVVEGSPNPAASLSGLYKGVAIGLAAVALFFFIFSKVERREFPARFLEAITENQKEVMRLSRDRFAQEYESLIYGHKAMSQGAEVTGIFESMDHVEELSSEIQQAAAKAETDFPYAEFPPDEVEKIKAYFAVLKEMDTGRHEYVLSLRDCLRLTYLEADEAERYCTGISDNWNKLAEKLLSDLTKTLELTAEEERMMKEVR